MENGHPFLNNEKAEMSLTIQGYRVAKKDVKNVLSLKGILTVKPYIPSVFVKPQFITKYPVYRETEEYFYVPKHYGIENFGPVKTSFREVPKTEASFWEFSGKIRDAQLPVVNSFLKPEPHDGVISLQTGGGKTVCALYIASELKLPTLVLVHSGFLKDQWVERIQAFLPKARVGIWNEDTSVDTFLQDFVIRVEGDVIKYKASDTPNFKLLKNLKPDEIRSLSNIMGVADNLSVIADNIVKYTSQHDITVGMLQGIMREDISYKSFKDIGFVIVDECHHIASEAFVRCIPKLTSKHMLGLSATPERKDRLMHVINWCLGPMLYQSNAAEKVDDGVKVEVYEFQHDDPKFNEIIYNNSGVMFTSLMVNKLTEFEPRNLFLIELLKDLFQDDTRQILVLSDRVEHTKKLFEMLPPEIQEHTGILARGMKPAVRTEFCESKRILISTYQLVKEGFDLASLNALVMGTSRPDVEQIVGRILRVEKTKRTVAPLIIDIVDTTFRRQFQERLSLYKSRSYQVQKMVMD
jgi:superfamily II DNA or RNA helicase